MNPTAEQIYDRVKTYCSSRISANQVVTIVLDILKDKERQIAELQERNDRLQKKHPTVTHKQGPVPYLSPSQIKTMQRKFDFWCSCIVRMERETTYFRVCNICDKRCHKN